MKPPLGGYFLNEVSRFSSPCSFFPSFHIIFCVFVSGVCVPLHFLKMSEPAKKSTPPTSTSFNSLLNSVTENSGGATSKIGTPGQSLHFRPFNDLTRRMSRKDMTDFLFNTSNLNEHEKSILTQIAFFGLGGMLTTWSLTFYLTKYLPWGYFNIFSPPRGFVPFSRVCFAFSASSIPFVLSQQWGLQQILLLPEESQLAFQTRRYLMTQRGNVLFTRSEVREVPKEEMIRQGGVGLQNPRQASMQAPPPQGGGQVEYALAQDQYLPPAQAGYKPPPS